MIFARKKPLSLDRASPWAPPQTIAKTATTMLYPLLFEPLLKEKIWGADRLRKLKDLPPHQGDHIGESWEISAVEDNISVVANGFLAGNTLQEVIEVYLYELVGEEVYQKFGVEFPLLLKFIDASQILSLQVHPDDKMARLRHKAYGKTEMWYVLEALPGSRLISGFSQRLSPADFRALLREGKVEQAVNHVAVAPGDAFFIEAGRIHTIGAGILLAEIQQTSDITYRIHDWGRLEPDGQPRATHLDLALEALDFGMTDTGKIDYQALDNQSATLVASPYFTTSLLQFDRPAARNYSLIDSFVAIMVLEGELALLYEPRQVMPLRAGQTVLVPASFESVILNPKGRAKVLEVFIP